MQRLRAARAARPAPHGHTTSPRTVFLGCAISNGINERKSPTLTVTSFFCKTGYRRFPATPWLSQHHVPQLSQLWPQLPPDPTKGLSGTSDPTGWQLRGHCAQPLQTQRRRDFCSSIHSNLKSSYQFKSSHWGARVANTWLAPQALFSLETKLNMVGTAGCWDVWLPGHASAMEGHLAVASPDFSLAHYLHGLPAPCIGLLPTACSHSCPLRPHSKPRSACSLWMLILKSPCFLKKIAPFSPAVTASWRPTSFGCKLSAEICFPNTAARQKASSSAWSPGTVPVVAYGALLRRHSENYHVLVAARPAEMSAVRARGHRDHQPHLHPPCEHMGQGAHKKHEEII